MFTYEPLERMIKENGDKYAELQRELKLTSWLKNIHNQRTPLHSEDIAKLSWYYGVPARDFVEYDYEVLPCYDAVTVKFPDTDNPLISDKPFMDMYSGFQPEGRKSIVRYLSGMDDITAYSVMIRRLKNDKNMSMKTIHSICKYLRCHLDNVLCYK